MSIDKDHQIREVENEPVGVQRGTEETGNPIRNDETAQTELRKTIEEMQDQIRRAEARSENLRKELAEAQGVSSALQQRVKTLNTELTREREWGEQLREQAGLLSNELVETEAILRQKSIRFDHIEASRGWRLERQYHAAEDRFFPLGTWRREAYRRTIRRLIKALVGGAGVAASSRIPPDVQPPLPSSAESSPAAVDGHQDPESRPEIFVHCYSPQPGEACGRRHLIRGWAAALGGIMRVEVLKDGEKLGDALFAPLEPKSEKEHARDASASNSNFFYLWDTHSVAEGRHTLTIRTEAKSGTRKDLLIPITVSHSTASRTYERWIRANERSPGRMSMTAKEATRFPYAPIISIVTPVFDMPEKLLREAMASVRKQIYPNWELCLSIDSHSSPELTRLLETSSREDPRIKYIQLAENQGMSEATNAAISIAKGEFVAFMDSDDLLSPDSLYWNIRLLQDHRDADLIYSDEDKLGLAGNRCDPFFKPDWSPDLLLSKNYISHLTVVRRHLLEQVGGLRSEYDGSQDFDLVLRLSERTNRIHHIPKILYHWRGVQTSNAFSRCARSKAAMAAERAIVNHLERSEIRARVEPGCDEGHWTVRYEILDHPKVGVILPTGGRMDLLQPCLESFFNQTDYPHYEILLVDNSKNGQVKQYAKSLASGNEVLRYLDHRDKKFNFSALNNFAVAKTEAPLLLLLNDDTTMVNTNWLGALVEHGQRTCVGAVGAKLIYPSGNIQHAGVVMGIYGCTSTAFKHFPANSLHYFAFPQMIRNCSAVTAACMLTRRAIYLEVGGLDEKNLAVAFQDVDYCLKLCKRGYYIVYNPLSVLIHHESVTKGEKIPSMRETRYMQRKWRDVIARDPFYSPHLTRNAEDYSVRLE